jgi:hypothetical protein
VLFLKSLRRVGRVGWEGKMGSKAFGDYFVVSRRQKYLTCFK